jgi:hypothetical protein
MANFQSSRFGSSDFGSSFSNSLFGSNLSSLIPSLLFGGLLRLGTPVFGGVGILGASALSFVASSLVSGLGANGFDQGGVAGGDFGFDRGGLGQSFGFSAATVSPACGAGANFWDPGWVWGGYCGPYPYRRLGWSGIGYFGGPGIGYNVTNGGWLDGFGGNAIRPVGYRGGAKLP